MSSAQDLVLLSQTAIRKGSKSFALASYFFAKKERFASWQLYSWCRYVDDLIDQAENKAEALSRLQTLEVQTAKCFDSSVSLEELAQAELQGLAVVVREFQIPSQYALDLLRGMRMDVQGREYENTQELLEYCYCVAGTVGLMMCHIMGLSRSEALDQAVQMGNAMQLTNICRDVADDWQLGRIYFPQDWLRENALNRENFAAPENRRLWALMSQRLLTLANEQYRAGWQGLDALPFRAAWAVAIAGKVYARIGAKVLHRGENAWQQRCYVTLGEKLLISLLVSCKLLVGFMPRIFHPWKAKPIQKIWSQT